MALNDLHIFDPPALRWSQLLPADAADAAAGGVRGGWPTGRYGHGFATAGGRLFVFGGTGPNGRARDYVQMRTHAATRLARTGARPSEMGGCRGPRRAPPVSFRPSFFRPVDAARAHAYAVRVRTSSRQNVAL